MLEWISAIVGDVADHETSDEGSADKMEEWMKDGVVIIMQSDKWIVSRVCQKDKMAFRQVII